METKELRIKVPEGYEIDKNKSTFEKIIFKKKDNKAKSWKEYCRTRLNEKETRFGYYIGNECDIITADWDNLCNYSLWRNVLPSEELAETFLAMMQLVSLRQDWIHKWSIDNGIINNWEPDWKNFNEKKWCVVYRVDKFEVILNINLAEALSFPTKELAEEFINTFKDLLDTAKSLV